MTAQKPSFLLLKLAFWIFWLLALILPVLAYFKIGTHLAAFSDFSLVFYATSFLALAGLSFVSGSCIERIPRLAYWGMITVGTMILLLIFLFAVTGIA